MSETPTRRNLLVTCGTSQISPLKFKSDGMDEELKSYITDLKSSLQGSLPLLNDLDQLPVLEKAEHISRVVLKYWDRRHELKGLSSIFGAEISTLASMEAKGDDFYWNPETDHITLIATQSITGLFAALAVQKIISSGWKVPNDQISIRMVEDLNENPKDLDQAMYNLAYHIGESLKESSVNDKWENRFIASGGFKSIMPCLTLFSFLFGIKLIYTYEFSDVLQALHPRFNHENTEARKFWQKTWQSLTHQEWMSTGTSIYLQYILQYRKDHPLAIF